MSVFCFFVWVWGFDFLHYTGGFVLGFIFDLGCFLVVVWVWELSLSTLYTLKFMMQCGSVGVGCGIWVFCCHVAIKFMVFLLNWKTITFSTVPRSSSRHNWWDCDYFFIAILVLKSDDFVYRFSKAATSFLLPVRLYSTLGGLFSITVLFSTSFFF